MSNEPFVRNVNPDKPDKASDVAHGAPGETHSSGAIEKELSSPEKEAWRLRGYANGSAFAARMMGDHPDRSPDAVQAYRWAEAEFNKIARSNVSVDEAVCGYGG